MQLSRKLNAITWALVSFIILSRADLTLEVFGAAIFSGALLLTAANLLVFRNSFRKGAEMTILLLPVFWLGAGAIFIWLAAFGKLQTILALVWAAILFLIETRLDRLSVQLFEVIFFVSAIGAFLGIWAVDFYFTPGWWIIMAAIFLASSLLLILGFRAIPASLQEKILYAVTLGLALTEVSWAMLFWPTQLFSTAAAFVGIFYAAWMITRLFLSRVLTLKKVLFNLILVGGVEILILVSAVWLPSK